MTYSIPGPILALTVISFVLCMAAATDAVIRALGRPRVRVFLLLRMFWLARLNWGVVNGWRVARMFERATRPARESHVQR